jgi:SNF2 family DNA or RNA helicase
LVSTFLNAEVEKENNKPSSIGTKLDESARETLESSLMQGASSSKLEAIMNELDEIWRIDPGSKILVFSQFLGFLDIITRSLNRHNITSYRIDGKMSLKERVRMIDRFNKESQTSNQDLTIEGEDGSCRRGSVFLVSMKAGGCGLNLVAASTVFIIDPWWNMAIEDVSSPFVPSRVFMYGIHLVTFYLSAAMHQSNSPHWSASRSC